MAIKTILLGRKDNESIFITKHSWDCNWYWGFGYLGNRNHHFHLESLLGAETSVDAIFSSSIFNQRQWWIIRDLFIQAYALKKAAAVFRHGGYQTTNALTRMVVNPVMEAEMNKCLEKVLDAAWKYMELIYTAHRDSVDPAECEAALARFENNSEMITSPLISAWKEYADGVMA